MDTSFIAVYTKPSPGSPDDRLLWSREYGPMVKLSHGDQGYGAYWTRIYDSNNKPSEPILRRRMVIFDENKGEWLLSFEFKFSRVTSTLSAVSA